uniref:Sulfatase N-terminal domain-containing protein n=1 Tax=Tetradesmus obliquus TaxID=3088 RepID=A0A383VL27_TETOB|eukprot:jgi/Sobl393_1/18433/SZX65529.1
MNYLTCLVVTIAAIATVRAAPAPKQLPRVPIPALPAGQQPNFIVILTDDQGWDDIGLHNPKYVNTPNIDKFIRGGTLFDNFYVTPQCAQTRAELLTGRKYARTGTMLVHGGYDFINSDEATAGAVMSAAGYRTAQYGKWHNCDVLGYEPWNVGFDQGACLGLAATSAPDASRLMRVNGQYTPGKEYFEDGLAGRAINFANYSATVKKQPFFILQTPHAIHVSFARGADGKPLNKRFSPAEIKAKYTGNPKYAGVSDQTLDAWAALEYLDGAVGKVFDFLRSSGLAKSTYVMLLSDNGSALLRGESKKLRMPSNMKGEKSSIWEGGVRNFMAVQGPGVQAGVVDSTLLDVTDILPTMADFARAPANAANHLPWDGLSFKNLLVPSAAAAAAVAAKGSGSSRGSLLANKRQQDRYIFMLGPNCWSADAVPGLQRNRGVEKPQKLLSYAAGGLPYSKAGNVNEAGQQQQQRPAGFQSCMAVRFRNMKWIGDTGMVYRFPEGAGDHLEIPQNEVPQPQAAAIAANLSAAAQAWWTSVIREPGSFSKPTFYLGLANWTVSNVLAAGAHDRTPGRVRLLMMGAAGFERTGDYMCFKLQVLKPGTYEVVPIYTSDVPGAFKWSVGTYNAIMQNKAPSITARLPVQSVMKGMSMGKLVLPATPPGQKTEACLTLVSSSSSNSRPVFNNLADIQIIRHEPGSSSAAASIASLPAVATGATMDAVAGAGGVPDAVPARSLNVSEQLRLQHGWVQGQGSMESLFAPYDAEDIGECAECLVAI